MDFFLIFSFLGLAYITLHTHTLNLIRMVKYGPLLPKVIKKLAQQGVITGTTVLETDTGHRGTADKLKGLIPQHPVATIPLEKSTPLTEDQIYEIPQDPVATIPLEKSTPSMEDVIYEMLQDFAAIIPLEKSTPLPDRTQNEGESQTQIPYQSQCQYPSHHTNTYGFEQIPVISNTGKSVLPKSDGFFYRIKSDVIVYTIVGTVCGVFTDLAVVAVLAGGFIGFIVGTIVSVITNLFSRRCLIIVCSIIVGGVLNGVDIGNLLLGKWFSGPVVIIVGIILGCIVGWCEGTINANEDEAKNQ